MSKSKLSSKSKKSINAQRSIRVEKNDTFLSKLTPEGGVPEVDTKYDCVAFLLHCPEHHNVAISQVDNVGAIWLPFTPLPAGKYVLQTLKHSEHEWF